MSNDDTLGATEAEAAPVEPNLPPPEDFNPDAWFSGVRATERSATLYQRGDLLADIEETERALQLAEAEDSDDYALGDTPPVDALNARLEDLYQQLLDSGVTFRVQGRSAEWLEDVEKEVKRSPATNGMSKAAKTAAANREQVARSIVQPEGITVEHLALLDQESGAQYRKLVGTFFQACSQAPQVTAPTSPSSSARRGGRGR